MLILLTLVNSETAYTGVQSVCVYERGEGINKNKSLEGLIFVQV